MISGLVDIAETVTVRRPVEVGRDALNVPVYRWDEERVRAICQPEKGRMLDRTTETELAYTLHMPRDYGKPLKGCTVVVRGEELPVVGDPKPHRWSPLDWGLTVHLSRIDG